MHQSLKALALVGLATLFSGCGKTCPAIDTPAVRVEVQGGAEEVDAGGGAGGLSQNPECSATVLIEKGDTLSNLDCSEHPSGDCVCYGDGQAGTYTITATLSDGTSEVQTVVVQEDKECGGPVTETVCFFGDCQ